MDVLLVRPENAEQMKAVKAVLKALHIDFSAQPEKEYNDAFVKKIKESRQQVKEGKVHKIDVDDLWK
jgi:hypothetical protein